MKTITLLASAVFIMIAGCAKVTYHGLKPIKPGIMSEVVVLRPTFKWHPSKNQTDTYDLIIYESSGSTGHGMPGKTVYYRESLETTEHTLEQDLVIGEEYYWSVRTRSGDKVDAWSRYDMFAATGFIDVQRKNKLFHLYVTTIEAQKEQEFRNR